MPEPTTRTQPPGVSTADAAPVTGDGGSHMLPAPDRPPASCGVADPPGYQLLSEIGRGGMGVVFRARDATLNRDVAVKILRDHYPADGPAARRFLEEAGITSQLQHPGVPPIHQVGTLPDGRPFLAMKLIKGHTLDELLSGCLSPAEDRGRFLAVFEQVCQTVGYAHSRGVVHRDIKPSNVMVGAFGEVQVMDWGVAKLAAAVPEPAPGTGTAIRSLREGGLATQDGAVLGTPSYMPPEQAGGETDRIGPRSDVFALGGVLCAILTDRPPYTGADTHEIHLKAIRGETGEALARLDGCGAEPELVALCKRCLAVNPADRPADAGEVAVSVSDFRAGAERRAREAELDRVRAEGELRAAELRAAEQRKRRRVQLALAAAVALLLAAGGAFAWWADRQRTDREAEEYRRRVEEDARQQVERERRAQNAEVARFLLDHFEGELFVAANWKLMDLPVSRFHPEQLQPVVRLIEQRLAGGELEELRPRFDRYRADLAFFERFERFESRGLKLPNWPLDAVEAAVISAQLRSVFEGGGIVPGVTPVDEVCRRANESLIKQALIDWLWDWWSVSNNPHVKAILDRGKELDPVGFRASQQPVTERMAEFRELAEAILALNQGSSVIGDGKSQKILPVAPPPREVKRP